MQTAQRIIKGYRRRRFIVCASLAVLVLVLTLSVRYVTERNINEQRMMSFNKRAINTLESVLAPLDKVSADVIELVGLPCEAVELRLREHVARMQTVRSIGLIKDGILYCSSIFGARNIPVSLLQPQLPAHENLLFLSTDRSLLKGSPILISWHPLTSGSPNGMMVIVNIEMLTGLMLEPERPWVSRAVLNVANSHLEYGKGLLASVTVDSGLVSHEMPSANYPFSITIIGPSPGDLALKNLPTQLPLALILSMLIGYITWLATANRMSFSWK